MNKRLYPLSREEFKEKIDSCIQSFKDGRGRPAMISNYDFFCGVLYVLRTGIAWRNLPECYGSWHTIYTRFKRWSESGWFLKLLQSLQAKKLIKVEFSWIDSTTIGVHRHGSGALKKRKPVDWSRTKGNKHKAASSSFNIGGSKCLFIRRAADRYESICPNLGIRRLERN